MADSHADQRERAAIRIFDSGVLDDIYEHAYQHGKRGRVVGDERDAMEDAAELARLALDETQAERNPDA